MQILTALSTLLLPLNTITSTATLYTTLLAATNLQHYEPATKKAATVSDTADTQLQKTRYTLGAGILTSLSSSVCSMLGLYWTFTNSASKGDVQRNLFLMAAVNAGLCLWVRRYIAGFWAGRAKVPVVGGRYNDGVRAAERAVGLLLYVRITSSKTCCQTKTFTDR